MQVMGRIGIMALGIGLTIWLGGAPVFAEDKPAKAAIDDG